MPELHAYRYTHIRVHLCVTHGRVRSFFLTHFLPHVRVSLCLRDTRSLRLIRRSHTYSRIFRRIQVYALLLAPMNCSQQAFFFFVQIHGLYLTYNHLLSR